MASTPDVTVVVATHNRADRLKILVDALAEQTLGTENFDVVIVDDGSRDATPQILEAATAGPLRLRTITQPQGRGAGAARNIGWRATQSPLIAFTDDDCRPDPEWLETLVRSSGGIADRIVQGRTQPDPREVATLGPFSKTIDLSELTPHYETCNILYPRAVLERVGGFDESYTLIARAGEDTDLGWRAAETGITAIFEPSAVVSHAVHQIGPKGIIDMALLSRHDLLAYKRNPALRGVLVQKVFYRRSHQLLLQALLALILARRTPAALLFAVPYLLNVAGRVRARNGGPQHVPFFVLCDTVEVAATAQGAVKHRVPII
jgi:glycosyltransferase involved in cell wall biosynthesis